MSQTPLHTGKTTLETRLLRILRRHLRDEDAAVSDTDFVRAVMVRFEKERQAPIIDVNE